MPLLDKYVDIKANEATFQKALTENDYDKMWECVFIACYNICKHIYSKRGFIAQEDDLYDTTMLSTMMVMRNIQERGAKPEKLSSYVYLRCLCHANGYGCDDKFTKKLNAKLSNISVSDYIEEELYNE